MNAGHWLWENGAWSSPALLPVTDRACRYGMALFETIRIGAGAPVQWREHAALLAQSASEAGFPVPDGVLDGIPARIAEFGIGEGMLRVYLTAGDGGPGDPVVAPRVFLLTEKRSPAEPGLVATLEMADTPHHPPPHGWKTANYWANLRALDESRSRGADEALLFGPSGDLISACMANVFLCKNGGLLTPDLSGGARPGVVRAWVLRHFDVQEIRLDREAVESADEIFLTSSGVGVRPACLIGKSAPHPRTLEIAGRYWTCRFED